MIAFSYPFHSSFVNHLQLLRSSSHTLKSDRRLSKIKKKVKKISQVKSYPSLVPASEGIQCDHRCWVKLHGYMTIITGKTTLTTPKKPVGIYPKLIITSTKEPSDYDTMITSLETSLVLLPFMLALMATFLSTCTTDLHPLH
ncbi:hypothetical protein Drorol1_Dr00014667 [Drosera rotundifolia]